MRRLILCTWQKSPNMSVKQQLIAEIDTLNERQREALQKNCCKNVSLMLLTLNEKSITYEILTFLIDLQTTEKYDCVTSVNNMLATFK
jgi:hypothetical protein